MRGGAGKRAAGRRRGGSRDLGAARGQRSAGPRSSQSQLNRMPFEQIGTHLNSLLVGATSVTTNPDLKQALQNLAVVMADAQALAEAGRRGRGAGAAAAARDRRATCSSTLANANRLVSSADSGVRRQLEAASRSRPVAEPVQRHGAVRPRAGRLAQPASGSADPGPDEHGAAMSGRRHPAACVHRRRAACELRLAGSRSCTRWRPCRARRSRAGRRPSCCIRSRWRGTSSGLRSSGPRRTSAST